MTVQELIDELNALPKHQKDAKVLVLTKRYDGRSDARHFGSVEFENGQSGKYLIIKSSNE